VNNLWKTITATSIILLLLFVLTMSGLIKLPTDWQKREGSEIQTSKLEQEIQRLRISVDSWNNIIKVMENKKQTITTYYHTVLKRNEDLTTKQIDTLYSLDTMSSHEMAAHIERADYFEGLYKEQIGIDSIRQTVIHNLDSANELQAAEIKVLKTEKISLGRKLESRNWWLKTISVLGIGSTILLILK